MGGRGAGRGSESFPFIVGCPRSGTTLLRAMLDSHPALAIPGESYFIVDLWEAFGSRRFRRFDVEAFRRALFDHERFQRWGLDESDVRSALADPIPRSYADAFRAVYATYARSHGKPRYGDKTPNYVLSLPLLGKLFPEARFVHIIRDGRDVALSVIPIESWGPQDARQAGKYWSRHVRAGRDAERRLGSSRYREIHYEALVDDPATVLADVCEFFGLEYMPEMLKYAERFEQVVESNNMPEIHQRLRRPPTKGLRSWRTEMDPADVAEFEQRAGSLLVELGYPLSTDGVPTA